MTPQSTVKPTVPDIPRDERLPGMQALLNPSYVRSVLSNNVEPDAGVFGECRIPYVRYKPLTNCLASYAVSMITPGAKMPATRWFLGKCYTADDFDTARQKQTGRARVISDDKQRIIILPADQDPMMAGLETAFDSRKLVRLLHRCMPQFSRNNWRISDRKCHLEIVRYKPEKRAVLRLSTRAVHRKTGRREAVRLYIRVYAVAEGRSQQQLLTGLATHFGKASMLIVPRTYPAVTEKNLLLMDETSGCGFDAVVEEQGIDATVEKVGATLGQLHTYRLEGFKVHTIADAIADVRANARTLNVIVPECESFTERIVRKIESLVPSEAASPRGFVHGDFHPGQLLFDADRTVVLDFDRAHVGDQTYDIGNFCAHLYLAEVEGYSSNSSEPVKRLVSSYFGTSRKDISLDRLKFWTIVGLFQLAVGPFRSQQPAWRNKVMAIIDKCLSI